MRGVVSPDLQTLDRLSGRSPRGSRRPAQAGPLKDKVFPTRELRVLTLKDGKREVRVV